MKDTNLLIKIMLVVGVILLGVPLLLPVVLGFFALAQSGRYIFDYLMPAELFVVVLTGAVLVLIAAILARRRVKITAWLVGVVVVTLAALFVIPQLTGLSCTTEGAAGAWIPVMHIILAVYWVAVLVLGVCGKLLLGDLIKKKEASQP